MFCIAGLDGTELTYSLKTEDEAYSALTTRDGIIPAPYLARHKWVLILGPNILQHQEWQTLVQRAYELVKDKLPKKVLEELNGWTDS